MTTQFYSTKVNKTVNIPDDKVCGYRMSNRATKKGWSSGLRSGKDNGVVNQKFSRFSKDWEAEDKHKCAGNRNWLNKNERLQFNRIRGGQAFSIKRPSFRAGEIDEPTSVPALKPNSREGLGNRDITRPNFISPSIKGREALNFERLQAQDISEGGIKVQLGDKTIEKLFKVQVDDPSDIAWIEEKTRRLAGGETEEQINLRPPFGRPQRKISQMKNLGAQGLSIDDNIEMLKSAVSQGNADNRTEMAQMIANTAGLLGNIGNLRNITQTGMNNLNTAIRRMFVPKHWRAMGFQHRYFSLDQYRAQAGLINLYLLSNLSDLPDGRTFETPLITYNAQGNVVGRASIIQLTNSLQPRGNNNVNRRPGKYIDLQLKAIIPLNVVVNAVNAGADGGQLNGQNPPAGPPNNGAWLPNVIPRWDFTVPPPQNVATQGQP